MFILQVVIKKGTQKWCFFVYMTQFLQAIAFQHLICIHFLFLTHFLIIRIFVLFFLEYLPSLVLPFLFCTFYLLFFSKFTHVSNLLHYIVHLNFSLFISFQVSSYSFSPTSFTFFCFLFIPVQTIILLLL